MMKLFRIHGHTVIGGLINTDSLVLDLGANEGAFSREAHQAFGCRTLAVEPNEALHFCLQCDAIREMVPTLGGYVVGDDYDERLETTFQSVVKDVRRELLIHVGLSEPGGQVIFKVYVILTTGNERASNPEMVTRVG